MKRTGRSRSRRSRYNRILARLLPGKVLFTVDPDEVVSDLDPGLLVWRAR